MIDSDGYRQNVGIMLANDQGQLLWAKRIAQEAWQFPQGGIQQDESPEEALFRELHEEIGLLPAQVEVIGCTKRWLHYKLPSRLVRKDSHPVCIGQKQKWFLLRLLASDPSVDIQGHGDVAEFDDWRWVSYWYPLGEVISFKREVYRRAMKELSPLHMALNKKS